MKWERGYKLVRRNVMYNNRPLIWPLPNECNWKNGSLKLEGTVFIIFDEFFKNEIEYFKKQLQNEGIYVSDCCLGIQIKLEKTDVDIINEEGYILDITEKDITIKARTCKGIFYGFQSLVQLISNSPKKGNPAVLEIPTVSIVDSPFKSVRGVHIYVPPRKEIEWFKRFIDFLARYKYNTIYMEIGAAVKFDSHPEINEAWENFCKEMLVFPGGPDGRGMQLSMGHFKDSVHIENGGCSYLEKSEFLELVDYMKQRHMEIIPEVQALSHAYWMLIPHKECAERQDDPYPDTYCTSNPKTYEIYFDCLEEIIDLIKPKIVHIGHDEYYTVGICEKCIHKSGHDILAEDVNRIYNWLKQRNIRTMMWGDKFIDYIGKTGYNHGGRERINFNWKKLQNEVMKSTYRAVDMVPSDLLIMDWYHSLDGEDTGSQDYFYHRGMEVVFGNFDGLTIKKDKFKNLDDRLRRPNVLGAEISLWHEVSDRGLAMKGNFFKYLDVANILWYEGYRSNNRFQFYNLIAQLYPIERDRINNYIPVSLRSEKFECIDISTYCNKPLSFVDGLEFINHAEPLPYTPSFDIQHRIIEAGNKSLMIKTDDKFIGDEPVSGNSICDRAMLCVAVGKEAGMEKCKFEIHNRYRGMAFLHLYSKDLGDPSFHGCTYIGWEKEIVGKYLVEYNDGSIDEILIEYSRTITSINKEFGAHWANPAFKTAKIKKVINNGVVSKTITYESDPLTIFSYEWENPYPEKEIKSISICHDEKKPGDIVLLGLTGIK